MAAIVPRIIVWGEQTVAHVESRVSVQSSNQMLCKDCVKTFSHICKGMFLVFISTRSVLNNVSFKCSTWPLHWDYRRRTTVYDFFWFEKFFSFSGHSTVRWSVCILHGMPNIENSSVKLLILSVQSLCRRIGMETETRRRERERERETHWQR